MVPSFLQSVANAILERRGSNSGVISTSAPSKYATKHSSPIISYHRNGRHSWNKVATSTADIESSSNTMQSNITLGQPMSPVLSNRDFNEKNASYYTPPQSPPPQPRPRTRNASSNIKKGKHTGGGK